MSNNNQLHKNTKDLTGQKFNRLTVIGFAGYFKESANSAPSKTAAYWFAECKCNKTVMVKASLLLAGKTQSCGCFASESRAEFCRRTKRKHGQGATKLYYVWTGLRTRCNNPRNMFFKHYGGRGITYTKEWESFETFRDWALASGYEEGLSIERIDVDGNYCPENCMWIPCGDQQKNKTNAVLITKDGETHSVAEWARITGLTDSTIRKRMVQHADPNLILSLDNFREKTIDITICGVTKSLRDWATYSGVPEKTIYRRYWSKIPEDKLLVSGALKKRTKLEMKDNI